MPSRERLEMSSLCPPGAPVGSSCLYAALHQWAGDNPAQRPQGYRSPGRVVKTASNDFLQNWELSRLRIWWCAVDIDQILDAIVTTSPDVWMVPADRIRD